MTTGHEILKPYSIQDSMREQIATAIDKEIAKAKEEQREKDAVIAGKTQLIDRNLSVPYAIRNNKE